MDGHGEGGFVLRELGRQEDPELRDITFSVLVKRREKDLQGLIVILPAKADIPVIQIKNVIIRGDHNGKPMAIGSCLAHDLSKDLIDILDAKRTVAERGQDPKTTEMSIGLTDRLV